MKRTAQAPANIALIKYWGKADKELRLPLNATISVNLSALSTITTVEFSSRYKKDFVLINNLSDKRSVSRVEHHLDRVRKLARINLKAKVVSKNNFAGAVGLASSASGFAALTLAAVAAAGLNLPEKKLSVLARQGSGSACRSIPDGWVKWEKGKDNQSSFSHSLYSKDYWPAVRILSVILRIEKKKMSSTVGMALAYTSSFFKTRLLNINRKIVALEKAISEKKFQQMGEIIEEEALEFHAITFTQKPAAIYWLPATLAVIHKIQDLRRKGLLGYFTIDAGPHLQIFCLENTSQKLVSELKKVRGVEKVIINKVSNGTRLIKRDLF